MAMQMQPDPIKWVLTFKKGWRSEVVYPQGPIVRGLIKETPKLLTVTSDNYWQRNGQQVRKDKVRFKVFDSEEAAKAAIPSYVLDAAKHYDEERDRATEITRVALEKLRIAANEACTEIMGKPE